MYWWFSALNYSPGRNGIATPQPETTPAGNRNNRYTRRCFFDCGHQVYQFYHAKGRAITRL